MTQNLVSLDLTDNLPKFDAALDAIEGLMDVFVSLTPDEVRQLTKIGDKSETFCRQTVAILDQNKQALPPGFDLGELKRDLTAFDTEVPAAERGKYVALTEENSLAVKHLKDLSKAGVTHLQILPAFDIATNTSSEQAVVFFILIIREIVDVFTPHSFAKSFIDRSPFALRTN